jgi:hypothetical protein
MDLRQSHHSENSMNFVDLINASLAEQIVERLREYVVRGRPFANLSEQALGGQWVELYRAVMALEDDRREGELMDLRSEFDLRGIEPPMHLVEAEAAICITRFKRLVHENRTTPKDIQRFDDELEELRERLSRPKH